MWPAGSRRPSRFASVLLALALAGCDGGAAAPPAAKKTIDSNDGRYQVEVETKPAAIEVNQPFDVVVTVTPKSGAAKDLGVVVDARMPAHFHGMNRTAKLSRAGGNTWKAEGLVFHMSGHWELYVDITDGGVTERAQMDVNLK